MKVGVIGSRHFGRYDIVKQHLMMWEQEHGEITTIISGGASGADSMAMKYAIEFKKNRIVHPALWGEYGKAAGPIRNQLIVNDSDHIIAFPDKNSVGTWITIEMAQKAGVPVTIIRV